ncbi:isochorismatase family protein [bacterium]|nr:MAG: isochorismatase family protein [bacterium]
MLRFDPSRDGLLVIDLQANMVPAIREGDSVVARARFLARAARLLGVPVTATEQNPGRLGSSVEGLLEAETAHSKMAFSAALWAPEVPGVVLLVGVETHICVAQTALDLRAAGREVAVAADAAGARTEDRHTLGLERMRAAGVAIVHSEAVLYEWLESAEHPRFREALKLVKES